MSDASATPLRWVVSPPQPNTIYYGSEQYVRCLVQAERNGVNYDPTADAVAMAFTSHMSPPTPPSVWTTGVWEKAGPYQVAQVLIGGTGLVLPHDEYDVWVKITDNPEVPELLAGQVEII